MHSWLRFRQPRIVLVAALLLTATATALASRWLEARQQAVLNTAVEFQLGRLNARMDAYVALLRATRALMQAQAGEVDREVFRRYVEGLRIKPDFPGIQGIGYSPRVETGQVAAFDQVARDEGFQGFAVHPAGAREWMFSILYLEPLDERNRAALGFDMFSEPVRAQAMARARDTGSLAMSGPVVLKQEIDPHKQAGFLVYVPLYGAGSTPTTLQERRARLRGFVYAPFRAPDFFDSLFDVAAPRVAVRVHSGAIGEPLELLHDGFPRDASQWTRELTVRSPVIGGQPWTLEFMALPGLAPRGEWLLVPAVAAAGSLLSVLLFLLARLQARVRLVTERRAAERAEAHARTDEENTLLETFVGIASHDLRNPLNVILLNATLLERSEGVSAGLKQAAERIKRSGTRALHLVHDLLDFTQVRLGKGLPVEPVTTDVHATVHQLVEEFRLAHPEHRIDLHTQGDGLGILDPHRFAQLVSNLLANALVHGRPGAPVQVRVEGSAADIHLSVHNEGDPVPEELRSELFRPLRRGTGRRGAPEGSIGLGLFIVEQIMQAHRGQIALASDAGGTTFTVRLPRDAQ